MLNLFPPKEQGSQPRHPADAVAQAVDARRSESQKEFMQMTKRYYRSIFVTAALCPLFVLLPGRDIRAEEQHIVVNIAPGEVNHSVFEQIRQITKDKTSDHVGLGIAAIFSYLNQPREQSKVHMKEFLSLAEHHNIPIVVQLDGEQWWGARPDLWNWWDPAGPGYDPQNRENVEWSGWGPEHAVKIAWRNWGKQIRVLPPPNFMSRRYREACHDEMRILVPLILKWWQELPKEKKHLLIGIKLGWESAIGVNSFYYPNGNALLDRSDKEDPQAGLRAGQIPDRGVKAIGYAAVMTAQLAQSGDLQETHLAEIVRRHLNDLCALAAELGTPREKLFTHVAGWKDGELLYNAAMNKYACPGWSFYKYASDPTRDKGVQRALQKSDAPYWAAVEWLLAGNKDAQAWHNAIERTLSDPKCRYLCIYNWRGIKNNRAAIDAIRGLLGAGKAKTESQDAKPAVEGNSEHRENHQGRKIMVAGIMGQPVREGNYKELNFRETEALIREAAKAGAQLVCTFEQFLDGYGFDANRIQNMNDKRIDRYEVIGKSKYVKRLGNLAKELRLVIVAGIGLKEQSGTYNSVLIFDQSGKLAGKYRKTHNAGKYATWFAALSKEQKKANCPSFDIGGGKIGVKICNDRHFRETTVYMVENGCELILSPSYGRYDPSRLKEDTKEFGVWAVFVHPRGCQFIDGGEIVFEKRAVKGKGSCALHEIEFREPKTASLVGQ